MREAPPGRPETAPQVAEWFLDSSVERDKASSARIHGQAGGARRGSYLQIGLDHEHALVT